MSGEDNIDINPSSSQEALDPLVNAGIERQRAEELLSQVPEENLTARNDQRSRASFEDRMVENDGGL